MQGYRIWDVGCRNMGCGNMGFGMWEYGNMSIPGWVGTRGLGGTPVFSQLVLVPPFLSPQLCQGAETTRPQGCCSHILAHGDSTFPPGSRNSCSTFSVFVLLLHVIEKPMAVKLKTHNIFTKRQVFESDFQHLEN